MTGATIKPLGFIPSILYFGIPTLLLYVTTDYCIPLLQDFMAKIDTDVIGKGMVVKDNCVDNQQLIEINEQIQNHPVECIGETLRAFMDNMKAIND